MGQYYKIVNLDKSQYISPWGFGDGAKLLEFGDSSSGAMTGLAILLDDGNGRGGGDLHSQSPIIGSWAGDRIVIAGDYADDGKFIDTDEMCLYQYAGEHFEDVSAKVIEAMMDDEYLAKDLRDRSGHFGFELVEKET